MSKLENTKLDIANKRDKGRLRMTETEPKIDWSQPHQIVIDWSPERITVSIDGKVSQDITTATSTPIRLVFQPIPETWPHVGELDDGKTLRIFKADGTVEEQPSNLLQMLGPIVECLSEERTKHDIA